MNRNISKFIEEVLLESALDGRIDDGIIDLKNTGHIEVIHEILKNKGLEENSIDELFESMLAQEGKYPERQAYNKEGWLVTFPSKEYRDAALKRGTHAISDPTHGRGGMNLYYKRRGKQRRQTQQQNTSVGVVQQPTAPTRPTAPTAPTAPTVPTPSPAPTPIKKATTSQPTQQSEPPTSDAEPESSPDDGQPLSDTEIEKIKQDAIQTYQNKKPKTTTQNAPEIATSPEQLQTHAASVKKNITEKFAQTKGWNPTQFGEWRDKSGQTKAVVSLSGEVTPINANEREELKLFAEKNEA